MKQGEMKCAGCSKPNQMIDGLFNNDLSKWYCFKCCKNIISRAEQERGLAESLSMQSPANYNCRMCNDVGCSLCPKMQERDGWVSEKEQLVRTAKEMVEQVISHKKRIKHPDIASMSKKECFLMGMETIIEMIERELSSPPKEVE